MVSDINIDNIIYECRRNKINFCLDDQLAMIYIDMSKLSLWERTTRKKEFVLWKRDIEGLRELIRAYDLVKSLKS